MSARRLADIDVLLQHIQFVSSAKAQVPFNFAPANHPVMNTVEQSQHDAYYESVLKVALETYLRGVGHPQVPDIRSVIGDEVFQRTEVEPLLRARLFMRRTMGTDVVPEDEAWKIQIFFSHVGNRGTSLTADLIETLDCFNHCNFVIDEGVRALLGEGQPYIGFATWVHGALWDQWEEGLQDQWVDRFLYLMGAHRKGAYV
ncbi:hypothetical protein K466DRAFT_604194 [Polyporus arcularius HHB13444]|uniref:Uncharacterized protein n=1 Tax=Polyporus arcularius HHB13444 TaxID=1314778 RepID=A0A5C3NZM1_9APHY|nr:hypothetical protein K466DRAFT_604194 [Polyporus arcularius HHB13444]